MVDADLRVSRLDEIAGERMDKTEVIYQGIGASQIGPGEKLFLNPERGGVQPVCWDHVAGERLPCRWVSHRLGKLREITAAHLQACNVSLKKCSRRDF